MDPVNEKTGVMDGGHATRLAALRGFMKDRDIDLAVFRDEEGSRDASLRYLSGHPSDGLLFVFGDGPTALLAWDFILAEKMAEVDEVIPYTQFGRSPGAAIGGMTLLRGLKRGARIELSSRTEHALALELDSLFPDFSLSYGPSEGAHAFARDMRCVKDGAEIALYRELSAMTETVRREIVDGAGSGIFKTEMDVSLFIERRLRELGGESTGFETLCAGPTRSFGIHAFPCWGPGPFLADGGLSILDFGIRYRGYSSDITMTFSKGALSAKQEEMIRLVEEAYGLCSKMIGPGVSTRSIAAACDAVFAGHGWKMPHALGHGIGLEAHEAPVLKNLEKMDVTLKPGMVIALEPGLYDGECGGARKENDFLVTAHGAERLTDSGIYRL